MKTFIELTRHGKNLPVQLNVQNITQFFRVDDHTVICFIGDEESYVSVDETMDEIRQLIDAL